MNSGLLKLEASILLFVFFYWIKFQNMSCPFWKQLQYFISTVKKIYKFINLACCTNFLTLILKAGSSRSSNG
jgi:hypothetical protein